MLEYGARAVNTQAKATYESNPVFWNTIPKREHAGMMRTCKSAANVWVQNESVGASECIVWKQF